MSAKTQTWRPGRRSRRNRGMLASLLFCAIALIIVAPQASAGSAEPTLGGWKGKTTQGTAIFFGVREGAVVANVRLTYRDAICGKASIHEASVSLEIDGAGHFSGVVYPANGGVELEGTFTGPRTAKGKIVAGEASGLPGCTGGTFPFTAGPKA